MSDDGLFNHYGHGGDIPAEHPRAGGWREGQRTADMPRIRATKRPALFSPDWWEELGANLFGG